MVPLLSTARKLVNPNDTKNQYLPECNENSFRIFHDSCCNWAFYLSTGRFSSAGTELDSPFKRPCGTVIWCCRDIARYCNDILDQAKSKRRYCACYILCIDHSWCLIRLFFQPVLIVWALRSTGVFQYWKSAS